MRPGANRRGIPSSRQREDCQAIFVRLHPGCGECAGKWSRDEGARGEPGMNPRRQRVHVLGASSNTSDLPVYRSPDVGTGGLHEADFDDVVDGCSGLGDV